MLDPVSPGELGPALCGNGSRLAREMGAWGAGIFDNDMAADARDEWREAIRAGDDRRR